MKIYSYLQSPIGQLLLVSEGERLTGLYMEEHARGVTPASDWRLDGGLPVLKVAEQQLREYFAAERQSFDLPHEPQGSAFQVQVWKLLREIPYGETRTYGDLAKLLGTPSASRAVGSANARNPISIIVPCHRVVGASGSLTGYAGGVTRKQFLLALERRERALEL